MRHVVDLVRNSKVAIFWLGVFIGSLAQLIATLISLGGAS